MKSLRRTIGEKIFGNKVAKEVDLITRFIDPSETILDIGSGTGLFANELKKRGYNVTPLDVKSYSYYSNVKTIVYDGSKVPFPDSSFKVTMLMAVLHHISKPEETLAEALRVSSDKIIILEDIYANVWQKYYTYIIDSILNKEFIGHPHTNKTDQEWKELFKKHDLKIVKVKYARAYWFLQNVTYYLQK